MSNTSPERSSPNSVTILSTRRRSISTSASVSMACMASQNLRWSSPAGGTRTHRSPAVVAHLEMPGAFGHPHGPVHGRLNIGRLAQVTLGDHLRFAAHPGHLPQVVVRLPADHLMHDRSHTLCTTPSR